jgi:hypothetical protein
MKRAEGPKGCAAKPAKKREGVEHIPLEEEEEEEEEFIQNRTLAEEEFIQNRTRAGARFLTRWDQHAVARRRRRRSEGKT